MPRISIVALLSAAVLAAPASAAIRITEWLYSGAPGEFVRLTNIGMAPIDMTGWRFDDDSRISSPVSATGSSTEAFDLSGFGLVQPGESVIFTEVAPATFRTAWGIPGSVKVLGPFSNNLGRNDEINIYDAMENLIDRLTYGDQSFPGSIRTQDRSGVIPFAALGTNDPLAAVFADTLPGSITNTSGVTGSAFLVPEPATLSLLALGGLLLVRRRQARQ